MPDMRGVNANTGKPLIGFPHLQQSIGDILSTPIGSRVMRRDYGSRLPELVDAPLNGLTIAQIYFETVEAILRWEPRVQPVRVIITSTGGGNITLDLVCIYTPTGETITMDGISV